MTPKNGEHQAHILVRYALWIESPGSCNCWRRGRTAAELDMSASHTTRDRRLTSRVQTSELLADVAGMRTAATCLRSSSDSSNARREVCNFQGGPRSRPPFLQAEGRPSCTSTALMNHLTHSGPWAGSVLQQQCIRATQHPHQLGLAATGRTLWTSNTWARLHQGACCYC